MAVAFTHLTSAGDTSNATSYVTASVSPTAGSLLCVWVAVSDADDPGTINISTGLTGVTWTEQFNVPYNTVATPLQRLKMWTGLGATGSGTITFSGMPDACQGALWFVVEATGQHAVTPVVQAASDTPAADASVTTETCTFAAYASSSNAVICGFTHNGTLASTAEGGWTAVDTEKSFATPDRRMWVQYQTSATDTTSSQSWTPTNNPAASGGIEIAVAAAAGRPRPMMVVNQSLNRAAVR